MEMMLNPWIFGLEAMQRGWQAQSALAFRLMRSLAGGAPDQTRFSPSIPGSVDVDIKAQEEVAANPDARKTPAAITGGQEAPAAIVDVRPRKAPKALRVAKKKSCVKARTVSNGAAAASGLIHSDDSQIDRSSSSSRHESRNCGERHESGSRSA
jgi:hypothetical protein